MSIEPFGGALRVATIAASHDPFSRGRSHAERTAMETYVMLTRFDPFTELNRLHDELFAPRSARAATFRPAVDIVETEEAFELHAELPGLGAEDFSLDVEKSLLTLRGERKVEETEEGRGFRRVERFHGAFSRSFQLPETVDAEAIEAKLADGVLTVRLPKRQAPGARKVSVSVN